MTTVPVLGGSRPWATAAALLLVACAGPTLTVAPTEPASAHYVDGQRLEGPTMLLPYYGTAALDAFPIPGPGTSTELTWLPRRTVAEWPEPITPWLFPLDFPAECLWHLVRGRGDRVVEAPLLANPEPAVAPFPLPGTGELRRRAYAARAAR